MGILELILLLILLGLGLAMLFLLAFALAFCKRKVYVGPTNNPRNGVIHVSVPGADCDSFTVRFETVEPVIEISGTIDLNPYSEPTEDGIQISTGPFISQMLIATYASPQTIHVLTFSNGSYGLEKGKIYKFSVGGRDRDDNGAGFFCKTRNCCVKAVIDKGTQAMQETTKRVQRKSG